MGKLLVSDSKEQRQGRSKSFLRKKRRSVTSEEWSLVKAWKQGLWPWLWLAKALVSYRRGRSTPRSELPSEQRNRGCPRLRQNWKVMMDATSSAVGKGHVASFDGDFPVSVGITDSAIRSLLRTLLCALKRKVAWRRQQQQRCWEGKERLAREQGHSGGRSSTYGRSGHEREGPRRSAETPNDASNGSNLTMGVGTVDSNAEAAVNSGTPEWSREIGKAVSSGAAVKERDGDRMKASPLQDGGMDSDGKGSCGGGGKQ
ncbi:hypothetical protein BHE74_00056412 [Ensete ventricosum]|nr:hypothetical protein BHE74_00056412 [Ensete ventricosum]